MRTMAIAVGRGALHLGTLTPLPTESLSVPPMCLSGQTGEQHVTTIALNLQDQGLVPGET